MIGYCVCLFITTMYQSKVNHYPNLLGNAIKYTPDEGRISLILSQDETCVHIQVTDSGYGIPKKAQDKLFSEFYRVRTQATADIPGTGLGLSLVKSVIDLHGGDIRVESEEGEGSTFFVELPLLVEDKVAMVVETPQS